jgi:hypothetical protein
MVLITREPYRRGPRAELLLIEQPLGELPSHADRAARAAGVSRSTSVRAGVCRPALLMTPGLDTRLRHYSTSMRGALAALLEYPAQRAPFMLIEEPAQRAPFMLIEYPAQRAPFMLIE